MESNMYLVDIKARLEIKILDSGICNATVQIDDEDGVVEKLALVLGFVYKIVTVR